MKTTFKTMPIKRSFQQYMSTQASNQEDKPLVIIIAGPTAGKKTDLLILNIIL
jgi:hypothetical protein